MKMNASIAPAVLDGTRRHAEHLGHFVLLHSLIPKQVEDFTLFFDKENGLPVKMLAKVVFFNEEFTQETTFANYKEFGKIKKATKIENKRDGEKFQELEVTEFKVLDKVDPKLFEEPK